jgi:hypothetical protein
LKYTDYLVEAKKTSTPDRDSTRKMNFSFAVFFFFNNYICLNLSDAMMNCSTVSSIVGDSKKSCINETLMASFVEPLPVDRREPPATPEKEPDAMAKLMKISLTEVTT